MKVKDLKICFVASSGGHLEEISQLRKIKEKYDNFLITEKINDDESKSTFNKVYEVNQINRKEFFFIIKFIVLFIKAFFILNKEKPDFVITTGALCSYPVCIIAKKNFKSKIIYIESFARCDTVSLTGKLMIKHADLFIVQWKEMLKLLPKAVYGGGIF